MHAPPTRLGANTGMENYQILGRIGEGAHGIVLKAKHIKVRSLVDAIQVDSTAGMHDLNVCDCLISYILL